MKHWIKPFIDLGPLLVFFVVYKLWGLMPATALLMVTTLVSLAVVYALERRIALTPLLTAIVVGIFGGLTLWLQDERFIKMKPTLINLLFASILWVGLWRGKPLLKQVLGAAFQMSEEGWRVLTRRWAFFFMALAALNEAVWRSVPTDSWVTFKVFGLLGLTFLFTFAQIPLMKKYMVEEG